MRKEQKRKIQELAVLLVQALDEAKQYWKEDQILQVIGILEECQDTAAAIGELIEETEGKNFKTIPLLEEYCELIYQLYERLAERGAFDDSEEEAAGSEDIYSGKLADAGEVSGLWQLIGRSLEEIRQSISRDIKERKEVVFLPYKASMWDSLESVWRAADSDPECDAYVIPIPYYDRNPDGSFGKEHYEGRQYPPDVPITGYDAYDMKERHPDCIFIHNPYDEHNYVTSVHPFFYAKNLKQYTDKLVYIPYFVLGEVDPNNRAAVNAMAHFAQNSAVTHADVVIVQSENMRQCYIESMVMLAGENTRSIWEKKILGLGSPKFDKAENLNRDRIEIPDSWKDLIGKEKKVILYNTSVTSLIKYKEGMLRKIRSVFETFQRCQDKVILLWRPHPLMEATIASMCPLLLEEYGQIVAQYQAEGWGIYDDSADLYRAIALSDAYYGDPSSVVQLCQRAGMPVMIQSVEMCI